MKIDFGAYEGATAASFAFEDRSFKLSGETDRLTDVLLCPPHYLAPVLRRDAAEPCAGTGDASG